MPQQASLYCLRMMLPDIASAAKGGLILLWQAHLHLPPPRDATEWLVGMEGLGLPCMAEEIMWQTCSLVLGI